MESPGSKARPIAYRDLVITPTFFRSAAAFRKWLERHHASTPFVWIGFWKKHTGHESITYAEAVDEALCFGWIDGLLKRIDADRHMQRYTPRRPGSIWSGINLRKAEVLKKAGRMAKAGLDAFENRDPKRAGLYSYQNRHVTLSTELEKRLRSRRAAWKFFEAQPPGYRRVAAFWVMNAKRPETRVRRLDQLIEESAAGRRLGSVTGKAKGAT